MTNKSVIDDKTKYVSIAFLFLLCLDYWICEPIGVDMPFHMLRIGELGKEIARDITFPVYMFKDVYYGYGYPIPIFYCATFLYPFALLVSLGLSEIIAYKIMVVTLLWTTFLCAYFCSRAWYKDKDFSFVVAFLYAAQPYFLMDLFVKASIGEAFAFLFIPLIILGYCFIMKSDQNIKGIIILACGMAGLVCSHVISTVLVTIALTVWFIVDFIKSDQKVKVLVSIVLSAILCVCISAGYILPMIEQLLNDRYYAQTSAKLSSIPQNVLGIFIPMHAAKALSMVTGIDVPMSEVGGAIIPVALVLIYMFAKGKIKELKRTDKILIAIYCGIVVSMTIRFVWIPLESIFGFMQFTWRIYLIAAVIGTALFILLTQREYNCKFTRVQVLITIFSGIYVLAVCFGYFGAKRLSYATGKQSNIEYSSETGDILYISQKIDPYSIKDIERAVTSDDDNVEFTYEVNEASEVVSINIEQNNLEKEVHFEVPFLFYKGYEAYFKDSNEKLEVSQGSNALVEITVPAGNTGEIEVKYTGTKLQKMSLYFSMVTMLIVVIAYYLFCVRDEKRRKM
ncbi:glycosyltransferase family protein [Butyrivibrio hungatei]|uniref:Membrane protein 6-pyruvoyl-tetrahydropterin synthase-related domain-containing protein n=1 Tax=Butyrivibrio hungatei TaxID=185008 RepID=A0A1D9NZ26_9FIRM|nr:hypothetical protein [Butyrivibrio hungatei]AOZ95471.1 hypothetical protein bhn_I0437 [Butyrivibrio hungatei]